MSYDMPALTDQEVWRHAQDLLEEHLPLHAEGYKCTTDDLFKVLLGVAATTGTLEAVCADLVSTPAPHPIRGYLNEQLRVEELPELEQQLKGALAARVPRRVRRHAQEVAIDYHDRPYYGKGAQDQELWVRGKAKDGTTRFYRVATAYLVLNGLRVTLALHFVLPADDTLKVLDTLLRRVKGQGLRLSCLLLDKGFDSVAVMEYLTRQGQPALLACTIRGTKGGTRALCQGRKSYCTPILSREPRGRNSPLPCSSVGCSLPPGAPGGCNGERSGCSSFRLGWNSRPALPANCIEAALASKPAIAVKGSCAAGPPPRIQPIALCCWLWPLCCSMYGSTCAGSSPRCRGAGDAG